MLQATSARLLWNAKGTAVLALTASETDASNKSYYGEQKLHFLAANGSNDSLVPLPKVRALSVYDMNQITPSKASGLTSVVIKYSNNMKLLMTRLAAFCEEVLGAYQLLMDSGRAGRA